VSIGDIDESIKGFWKDTLSRYEFLKHDLDRPILPPAQLFLDVDQFFTAAKPNARLSLDKDADRETKEAPQFLAVPDLAVHRRDADPLNRLRALVSQEKVRVLICSDSNGRKESIRQLLEESNSVAGLNGKPLYPIKPEGFEGVADFIKSDALFGLVTAQLFNGFTWPLENLIVVTEAELFTTTARQRRKGKEGESADPDMLFKDLSELKIGDPVVHSDHGIGRYQGLVLLNLAPPKEDPIFELIEDLTKEEQASIKSSYSEMPESLKFYYQQLKKLEQLKGIQMRMPYEIVLN
jgi:transcription-repair coupling factor (superfamily II helicase)